MDHEYSFESEQDKPIVYVRAVSVKDLPAQVRDYSGSLSTIYAVHDVDGVRLALVRDRKLAFALARQNDMSPVNVH